MRKIKDRVPLLLKIIIIWTSSMMSGLTSITKTKSVFVSFSLMEKIFKSKGIKGFVEI